MVCFYGVIGLQCFQPVWEFRNLLIQVINLACNDLGVDYLGIIYEQRNFQAT